MSKRILVLLVFLLFLPIAGFSQYYELVGKYIEINGPDDFSEVGVAFSESTCDKLIHAINYKSKRDFDGLLEYFDVARVKNHTSAFVVDAKYFEGKAKVVVLSGLHKGISGWIPIEWLARNSTKTPLWQY